MQAAAGFLRLGKLMRLVPQPVIFKPMNGLAIIIGEAKLSNSKPTAANGFTAGSWAFLWG